MRVLFVASEIYPFVKTGGLGDVAGALPQALLKEKIDVRILVPGFKPVLKNILNPRTLRTLTPFFGRKDAKILVGKLGGVKAYVLDCPSFYDREGPYGDEKNKDWPDNHLRFAALCQAAADIGLYDSTWQPDIIHGNDWQCGLIPAYLNLRGRDRAKSVITIHNIAYQGLFPPSVLPDINLPPDVFSIKGIEFYGKVGFMKAGLQYADKITTVSPTYAKEIQGSKYGCGLDGLLRERSNDVVGILNGIDKEVWNPKTDSNIFQTYSRQNLKNKILNRERLLTETGLTIDQNIPLFGVISRLVSQKGLDLLVKAAPEILKLGAGLVVLGSGDKALEKQFQDLASAWPTQVYLSTAYDELFAHNIMAGADAVLVPSRFEPCGLVQMYGLRYGTLPIVRKTGGLADTVTEDSDQSTGFVFEQEDALSLSETLLRACALYRSPKHWKKRQVKAMSQDFGWSHSARQYANLYKNMLEVSY